MQKIERYGNRSNVGNILDGSSFTQHQRVNLLQNKSNHPDDGKKRQNETFQSVKLPSAFEKPVKMTPAQRAALIVSPRNKKPNPLIDEDVTDHWKTLNQAAMGQTDAYSPSKRNFKRKTPFTQWSNAYFAGGVHFNPPVNGI